MSACVNVTPNFFSEALEFQDREGPAILRRQSVQGELVQMRSGVAMAALVNGDIDYHTVIGSGIAAAIQRLPVRVVACFVPAPPIALLARPEFKSVKDLKGQTIGANPVGASVTSASARLILRHFGLDPEKDVKFNVRGDGPARLALMKEGLIAATLGSAPIDHQGTKMGFVILAKALRAFQLP
jgi:ABC-type nitrate/sulfonate/bicarbonate transport system substrate-binding protein